MPLIIAALKWHKRLMHILILNVQFPLLAFLVFNTCIQNIVSMAYFPSHWRDYSVLSNILGVLTMIAIVCVPIASLTFWIASIVYIVKTSD